MLVLQFDYAQNFPLPKTNETSQIYKRLVWVYLFNMHCHNIDYSQIYHFLETDSKKNPDRVCSFLFNKVDETFKHSSNKEIPIKFNSRIIHVYPVRGHSLSMCDRNFALCGAKINKEEKIHTLTQYAELLES
ncbi:hypothetical protein PR048_022175 [Dryococelus australis]|uniref:Uncharacterized protein n=1 Tax=Dryococelus australis TaxID=614101 RepID=A0ABQ9H0C7_9NEOP|nr:hypothetical protein PR048_022175 [Dryococelus australis]